MDPDVVRKQEREWYFEAEKRVTNNEAEEEEAEEDTGEGGGEGEEVDHLDVDPPIKNQHYCCFSFATPQNDRLTELESMYFEEFLKQVDKEDLLTYLEKPGEIQHHYKYFKYTNKLMLDNLAAQRFPKQWIDRAVKFRGAFKTIAKAKERAKFLETVDKDFKIFIGETFKWCPYDPSPKWIETYDSNNKELNNIIKGHKEQQKIANQAFEIRKKGYELQAKRRNAEIHRENLKYIESEEAAKQFEESIALDPNFGKLESRTLTEEENEAELQKIKDKDMHEVDII